MDLQSLNNSLDDTLEHFKCELKFFNETQSNTVDKADVYEITKQTWYALASFKDNIIKYLEEK